MPAFKIIFVMKIALCKWYWLCIFQSIGLLLGIVCMDFRKAMTMATITIMIIMLLGKLMLNWKIQIYSVTK